MKFLKNNFWTIASLVFVLTLIAADSFAQTSGNTLMQTATKKTVNVFQSVKTITFILGGFGLIGIAYQAIIGKVKWSWFAGLAVGLALLAAAGAIVEYATGDTGFSAKSGTTALGDTFSQSAAYTN